MKLERYLGELKNCPDEQLRDELGVYDNWVILLNAGFDDVAKLLMESGRYEHKETFKKQGRISQFWNYLPGTVYLQAHNWVHPHLTTYAGQDSPEPAHLESKKQLSDYNIALMLHPAQEKKMEGVHMWRALAIVIQDIGQFAIRENVPICMPQAVGWKYRHPMDYSRIVHHEPLK